MARRQKFVSLQIKTQTCSCNTAFFFPCGKSVINCVDGEDVQEDRVGNAGTTYLTYQRKKLIRVLMAAIWSGSFHTTPFLQVHHGSRICQVNGERLGANGLGDWHYALSAYCEIPGVVAVVCSQNKGILPPGTNTGCTRVVSALGFGKYAERGNTGKDPSGAHMEIQYFNHIFWGLLIKTSVTCGQWVNQYGHRIRELRWLFFSPSFFFFLESAEFAFCCCEMA